MESCFPVTPIDVVVHDTTNGECPSFPRGNIVESDIIDGSQVDDGERTDAINCLLLIARGPVPPLSMVPPMCPQNWLINLKRDIRDGHVIDVRTQFKLGKLV